MLTLELFFMNMDFLVWELSYLQGFMFYLFVMQVLNKQLSVGTGVCNCVGVPE